MKKNMAKTKKSLAKKFLPAEIEPKWQAIWEKNGIYQPDLGNAKRPYYVLTMFPYPSAEGLHVGFSYTSAGIDAYSRYKRMQGYDVFEPIGLDGFGIHAENHAIKTNSHPIEHAERTEKNFYRQLHETGNSYAWKNKVETYDPHYYKWTQWLFTELFKAGLAYKKESPVNFCPSCKTVLADEQVIDEKCERCNSAVEKKQLSQWFFGITKYASRLLENIDNLHWSEKVKTAQRNWIGKKTGINIRYKVVGSNDEIEVFTTRPDTNFGATFIALAPEHPLVLKLTTKEYKARVETYIAESAKKSEIERQSEGKEKTGVFTGSFAINELTGYKMPIWVSDFVLMGFGTGALVGVPGHDKRDFEFAQKFGLEIKRVVKKNCKAARSFLMGANAITDQELGRLGIVISEKTQGHRKIEIPKETLSEYEKIISKKLIPGFWNEYIGDEIVFLFKHKDGGIERIVLSDETNTRINTLASQFNNQPEDSVTVQTWLTYNDWYADYLIQEEEGTMIHSGFLDGMDIHTATEKIMDHMEEKGYGKRVVNYHLRDWLISRQRYWGPPIPMVYCQECAKDGKSWFTVHKSKKKNRGIENQSETMLGWYPVPVAELPVKLPYVENYKPLGTGKAPLANYPEFYETTCPGCGGQATRETDVSDTFLDSAWYFFRYISSDRENVAFDIETVKKWLPVHMYIGGAEHSVLHLLYARFITMVLRDLGFISFEEPFSRFYAHGLIIKDGAKMSKSKGNVINPDEYIRKYGADTLRMYLMFLGPFDMGGDFRDTGIEGMSRFLKRIWKLFHGVAFSSELRTKKNITEDLEISAEGRKEMHKTIKGITEDMENLRFNTVIAKLMTWYNFLSKQEQVSREETTVYLKLLAPFAPHMTEELFQELRDTNESSIHISAWPVYDPAFIKEQFVRIVIQVNGKMRGTMEIESEKISNRKVIELKARQDEKVMKFLTAPLKKVIYIPGKILNFVV
jgi:leucyl-tRNA synthetase